MRFEIWQAPAAAGAFDREYHTSHPWKCVWREKVLEGDARGIELGIVSKEQLLEAIFTQFQRVDNNHKPPEGYTGRSLTMGDLVALDNEAGWRRFFFCERMGWTEVAPPVAARSAEPEPPVIVEDYVPSDPDHPGYRP